MWLCPPGCPTRGQGTPGTAGRPGPPRAGELPAHLPCGLSSSSTPRSSLQKPLRPTDLLPPRAGYECSDGERSQGGAEDAQPLLPQIYSQFLQLPAPSCMTTGEICFAKHSPLCSPPLHTAKTSLPPKPWLIFRLHIATTHTSLGTSRLTRPCTSRH